MWGQEDAVWDQDFDRLFRDHYRMVYHAAYGVLGNTHDAEDVAQTVFLRLSDGRPLQPNPEAYLYRAAVKSVAERHQDAQAKQREGTHALCMTAAALIRTAYGFAAREYSDVPRLDSNKVYGLGNDGGQRVRGGPDWVRTDRTRSTRWRTRAQLREPCQGRCCAPCSNGAFS